MKEPKNHRPFAADHEGDDDYCAADGDKWPCKKWKKWTASPKYRLGEIEMTLAANQKREDVVRQELRETKEKLRRLELLVRGGVMLALCDNGAQINENITRDYQDVGAFDGWGERVAGPEEYTVTFTGKNSRYVNGRLEESWS